MRLILVVMALVATAVMPASAQAANPVPQAPVIPVIAKSEVLPFTIQGGGAIEVAVLTGSQTPAEATWTTRNSLPLIDYAGQDIRVLARRVGVTNQADFFDASYKVRDTYPPGTGLGTPSNPETGVIGNSNLIRGWATGWENYEVGTDVDAQWQVPANAVGPVGGTGYEGNLNVVVLGNGGRITMTFAAPITDGPGYDLAVFENGFRESGKPDQDWLEFGYVEVSSNGTDFVRFDSGNLHDQPVGPYGTLAAKDVGGVAGRDLNGYGTPFDLSSIKNKPAVRDGLVDINNITKVRIKDIQGTIFDGVPSDLDSFGRPIFDAWKTWGSGGFDLRGVGALNVAGATIVPPKAAGLNTTTARVKTSVGGATAGAQDVRLEWTENSDHSGAVTKGTATTPADGSARDLQFDVSGLTAGQSYWYRVVSASGNGDEVASEWARFDKVRAVIPSHTATALNKVQGKAQVRFSTSLQPKTDGDQTLRVEYAKSSNLGQVTVAGQVEVPGTATAQPLNVTLDDLDLATDYSYRAVSRSSDGVELVTEWKDLRTDIPAGIDPLVRVWAANGSARVRATVHPGTGGDIRFYLESARNSGYTNNRQVTETRQVSGSVDSEVIDFTITGLLDGTNRVRAVIVNPDDSETKLNHTFLESPGSPTNLTANSATASGATATVKSSVFPNTHGPQEVHAELSKTADQSDEFVVSESRQVETDAQVESFEFTGLEPGATYWARIVSESTMIDTSVASAWMQFTVEATGNALGTVRTEGVSHSGAKLIVPVTPAGYDRDVLVQYSSSPDHSDPSATAAQTVPAGAGSTDVEFSLEDLESNRTYQYRVLSTAAGVEESSPWASFSTPKYGATSSGLRITETEVEEATAEVGLDPGDLAQEVKIEYRRAGFATLASEVQSVAARSGEQTLTFRLAGLIADTSYEARAVITAADDDVVRGNWTPFRTKEAPVVVDPPVTLPAKTLGLKLKRKKAKRGTKQVAGISGLAPGEAVKVRFRGRVISKATAVANAKGAYRIAFKVTGKPGKAVVKVTGSRADRKAQRAFRVVRQP